MSAMSLSSNAKGDVQSVISKIQSKPLLLKGFTEALAETVSRS